MKEHDYVALYGTIVHVHGDGEAYIVEVSGTEGETVTVKAGFLLLSEQPRPVVLKPGATP